MSQKERDRVVMLSRVKDRQITLMEASNRLGLSYRQAKRPYRRYVASGDSGLVHGLRGRPSNNLQVVGARRDRALSLYREHYVGFGPTLAAEQLADRNDLVVNHETLRGWLTIAGLWKPRRDKGRRHRRWRPRRPCFGELVQFDGSDHAWFGEDHPRCTLMVMIDDATSRTWGQFYDAETVRSAMSVFRGWAERYGLPRELYPDRHSIHRRNDKEADEIFHRTGERPLTRFGKAMAELGVAITCAHSPQAKGRVERVNGTLQDRLVKLLALEGITTMDAANAYLEQTYFPQHNAQFAVTPEASGDAHQPAPLTEVLSAVLCLKEQRAVGRNHCVQYHGRWFQIEAAASLPRRRPQVEMREHLDGRIELWAKDQQLPCKELTQRPKRTQTKPDLAARVAEHKPPCKPSEKHPWRQGFVTPVPAAATVGEVLHSSRTRYARPPCTADLTNGKGTFLLG